MLTTGSAARLLSNSRWNIIAFSVTVLINFVTIPVVISHIGLGAFGTSGLIIAIYAPFMLIGTVLGQFIVREFSQNVLLGKYRRSAHLYSAALSLCAAGCFFVITALTVVGGSIINLIVKDADVGIDWRIGFLITGAGWAAQQGILLLQATIISMQKYNSLASISIATALVSAMSVIICVLMIPTFLGFLIGTSIGFLLSIIIWVFLVRRLLPWLFPVPLFFRQHLSYIFKLGKWQGGAQFVGAIGNQIDRYVLGVMAPIAVVGQYNVAMRLQEVVHMGLLKITEVLFPHFAITVNDSLERRALFFMQVSWIIGLVGLVALAPLIPLSEELITIWAGAESANGGGQILRTLSVAGILGSCVNVYFYFAIGTGQNARVSGLSMVHALLTVSLTIIFIGAFGPLAAGVGYLIANLLRLGITLRFIYLYFRGAISLCALLFCLVLPLIIGFIITWYWVYTAWFQPDGWATLLIDYILIACSIFLGVLLATFFSKDGRQLISNTIFSYRNNIKQGKVCAE